MSREIVGNDNFQAPWPFKRYQSMSLFKHQEGKRITKWQKKINRDRKLKKVKSCKQH